MQGSYNRRNGIFTVENDSLNLNENSLYVYSYIGRLASTDPTAMIEQFATDITVDFSIHFVGPYILLVFDKLKKTLTVTQHMFGGPCNLYFCQKDEIIYFGTTLSVMKHLSKIPFRLNASMLPHFLYNGFLPKSHTLIQAVYKLSAGFRLQMNQQGIQLHKMSFDDIYANETISDHITDYHQILKGAVRQSMQGTGDADSSYTLALSSGYDSNFILYQIQKIDPNANFRIYSVGGVKGIDETQTATKIADLYQNTVFNKSLVSPKTFDQLDDIVKRLEGSVYERGIFLQYELAKKLSEHNINHLICGECADQVFHVNTYADTSDTFLFDYANTPYEMATNVVFKKSTIMLNSFGIKGLYPYLDTNVVRLGYHIRHLNGVSKEFHKSQCEQLFPKQLMGFISKKGGTTDLESLFEERHDTLLSAKKCKFYKDDFIISKKFVREEAIRDYYVTLRFLESFESQFCDKEFV